MDIASRHSGNFATSMYEVGSSGIGEESEVVREVDLWVGHGTVRQSGEGAVNIGLRLSKHRMRTSELRGW